MSKNGFRLGVIGARRCGHRWGGRRIRVRRHAGTSPPKSRRRYRPKAAAAITLRLDDLNARDLKGTGDDSTRFERCVTGVVPAGGCGSAPGARDQDRRRHDVATALTDSSTIFTSYRVLALVLPAAHVAAAALTIDVTAIPALTAISAKAASHVNSSNGATLQPLIDDLNAQIQSASDGTANVASTLLAYTAPQMECRP